MIRSIAVSDTRGTRRFGAEEFPIALGGAAAHVAIEGVSGRGPVAWLGESEGDLFLQISDRPESVSCNGSPVATSQWLHDGDVLRIAKTEIVVDIDGESVLLSVGPRGEEDTTDPPVIVPVRSVASSADGLPVTTIRPVEFRPGTAVREVRGRRRFRPATLLVWAVLAALAPSAWLLFTTRSVEVLVEPDPDQLRFVGGVYAFELGGRYVLRPGSYTLVAEKAGYRRLEVPVEITAESNQRFRFELEKLAGRVRIDTGAVEGAEVVIDGRPFGVTPLPPVELPAGEHQLAVVAERYAGFTTPFRVEGQGTDQTVEVELSPLWAEITFRSNPGGASVTVDGHELGQTPLTAELLEGRRRFELRLAGRGPQRGTVEVEAGRPLALPVVELAPSDGKLMLNSEPPGATVAVAGEYRGQTPLELFLRPGPSHEITLSLSGHEPATEEVTVRSDRTAELTVRLAPKLGEVRVEVEPAGAELFVNGVPHGPANQTLRLVAVPQRLELRKEGYEPHSVSVTPRPGYPQSVRVTLKTAEQLRAQRIPPVIRTAQGQELILVEGGRFRMGASRREPGRRANETLREVELSRAYYLAQMEVSNKQFREFSSSHRSGEIGGFNLEIDHHPVVRVTWEDAALYCNWLSQRDSLPPAYEETGSGVFAVKPLTTGYRLPTEAEWAWAARYAGGRDARKFPWGDSLPVAPASGNYADETAGQLISDVLEGYNDGYPVTAPVDSFRPDPLGLLNLGGNVAEWVHDIYTVYGSPGGKVEMDPVGPDQGELHVIRGSSWMDSSVSELRLSYRDYGNQRRPDLGFRIARYAE